MPIEFTGKADLNINKAFHEAFNRAYTKSVEYIFSKCFEYAPVGKSSKGAVNLRNALKWDFDKDTGEANIGIPAGSEMEKIAMYVELGTGLRGSQEWKQWFDEKRPNFTIPIVPVRAKAMHFVDESGKDVFLKKSKGQSPQSFVRRAFYDSKPYVEKIWASEFKDSNFKQNLKFEKV